MGRDTRLRAKTKKEYDTGASIYKILHPNTASTDPTSLIPSSELIKQQILSNSLDSKIIKDINFDLTHAIRVYNAFSIDPDSKTSTVDLETQLKGYELTTESRDINELEDDILNDTIQALKTSKATNKDIRDSFVRSSVITGVTTLELLAKHLSIVVTLDMSDLDLATSIKTEIDLL